MIGESPVVSGSVYRHFKGLYYEIIGIGKDSETLEPLVIYRSLADNVLWVRSYTIFMEEIEHEGKRVARFEKTELEAGDLWWMKKESE